MFPMILISLKDSWCGSFLFKKTPFQDIPTAINKSKRHGSYELRLKHQGLACRKEENPPAIAATRRKVLGWNGKKTETWISNLHISNISIVYSTTVFSSPVFYFWTFLHKPKTCRFKQTPTKSTSFWKSLSFGTGGVPKLGGAGDLTTSKTRAQHRNPAPIQKKKLLHQPCGSSPVAPSW